MKEAWKCLLSNASLTPFSREQRKRKPRETKHSPVFFYIRNYFFSRLISHALTLLMPQEEQEMTEGKVTNQRSLPLVRDKHNTEGVKSWVRNIRLPFKAPRLMASATLFSCFFSTTRERIKEKHKAFYKTRDLLRSKTLK